MLCLILLDSFVDVGLERKGALLCCGGKRRELKTKQSEVDSAKRPLGRRHLTLCGLSNPRSVALGSGLQGSCKENSH